jgi:ligand-binding sensor domain-containing protein/signal transduction histidine kinase
MPNHRWTSVLLWLCLLIDGPGVMAAGEPPRASSRYIVDSWENDNDLPQNSVISMTQTRDGYLWLGTINGLVRFDGIRFTVYDEYNTPGLASTPISSLYEDRKGNLWIGTDTAGVALARDGQVISLGVGAGSKDRRLAAIGEDQSGAVWLHTQDGQLWRFEEGQTNQFRFFAEFPSERRALMVEPCGLVWAAMDRAQAAVEVKSGLTPGLTATMEVRVTNRLDVLLASGRGGYWRLADAQIQKWHSNRLERVLAPYPWSPTMTVTVACEDREGNPVVGTLGGGLWLFDANGQATHLSTTNGLSNDFVLSLLTDREGALWVGTDGGGLCRVRRQVFEAVEATRGLTVQSVSEGERGLWVGFNSVGYGAFGVARLTDGALDRFGSSRGVIDSSVRSVFVDRNQRVWVGTYNSGLFQKQSNRFEWVVMPGASRATVFAIHEDHAGALWFGTRAGLNVWNGREWKSYTTQDGLAANEVRAVMDDREGNLWIGTRGGGVSRLRDGQWTTFSRQDGLPSDEVSSLYADAEGVLWVGTFGSGLARFHGGRWTRYSIADGLAANSIGYLTEDGLGYLWIGSNRGLMRAKKGDLNDFARGAIKSVPVRAYGRTDGMPTRECSFNSQPASWRARDGHMWFSTTKGLVSIDPTRIELNTNPPPVVIGSVLIDGQEQIGGLRSRAVRAVTMAAGKERVEIRYSALNLSAPERARFKHRLEGYETAWAEVGDHRVASYSRLPPGQYRFQVTASNEDGIWNLEGASLTLVVEPHFWQTLWFLCVAGAAAVGLVAGAVYYVSTQRLQQQLAGLRQQEALEQERARIARDIHDQLGANLTQVSLLGELVESDRTHPEEVAAHARQISQTALETSRALDEIVWTVNPRNDTLDGLVNYICKYAQEYLAVAGLRYRLEIPPDLPNAPISPEVRHNVFLASKEAVTNVVRHAQASSAWLRLKLKPDRFTLEIQDDGRGPAGASEARAQTRNGLRNMAKRMEDVGGRFEIGPAPERGTLVRLTAPLAKR